MPEPESLQVRQIEVERLVLREPGSGRVRAVLELKEARESVDVDAPVYLRPTLTFLTAAGDPALVLELDEVGRARVSVGHPDVGTAMVITRESVSLWSGGNEVAVLEEGTQ